MEGKKQPIPLCVEVTQTFALLPNVAVEEVASLPLTLVQPLPLAPTISPHIACYSYSYWVQEALKATKSSSSFGLSPQPLSLL